MRWIHKKLSKWGLLLVLVFLGSSLGQAGGAQTPVATPVDRISKAFAFYPSDKGFGHYFESTVNAGDSVVFEALLGNTGDVAQSLSIYPVDAFTAQGGGFASAETGDVVNEVTQWLNFPKETVALEPDEGVNIGFSVHVPEDTPAGQYIAAVAAEQSEASQVEGSDVFSQKLRYVIPVFITVPGKTSSSFEIGDISLVRDDDFLLMTIELDNTGDVRVRPQGDVEILDEGGTLVASIPVEMQSIYARDETTLTLGVPGAVEPGRYTVAVNLQDPETKVVTTAERSGLNVEASATQEAAAPIQVVSASIAPGPSADNIQLVTVDSTIANNGDPVANAQLSLLVSKDGEQVERFPISQSLSLPQGETQINTRYIPAEGFSSGTWTFELLLETVDPSGAAVVVASQPIDTEVVIP